MPYDDNPAEFDFRDDEDEGAGLSPEINAILDHLRNTLTPDMARRMVPNRFGIIPANDVELERMMEELIADAYNDGYDSWDRFPS